ncbi:serine/threonine protein kinase [Phormidium sp. CCY1219]|uniref:serine/threonine protein kinase n=1 Tax=Phormidium sp. CCY1219 TaxID=2886104 RepID=UPI002D1E99A8|nr:protein kinase [Phormidium sp. CCY1219]MEB3826483.1 protein kinase [Phormidium sp. CCY1219]
MQPPNLKRGIERKTASDRRVFSLGGAKCRRAFRYHRNNAIIANVMETLHHPEDRIKNRYRITHTLGRGGICITYAAEDLETGKAVAIKTLSLRATQEWKAIELFEREAKVLSQLEHSAIPDYLDYFQIDTSDDRRFYIVQELAEGQSLEEAIGQIWKLTISR